jgi:predicted amidophosphoribosyltransferase
MVRCRTCGAQIQASARICPSCGALTGVEIGTGPNAGEPPARVFSFIAAVTVGIIAASLLRWLSLL